MVRRVFFGSVVGSVLIAALVVQGCVEGDDGVWRVTFGPGGWEKANCDPCQPVECCTCPWVETCKWGNPPRKVPDWCDDWKADGGNLCTEAGTDGGMMSLCANGTCLPAAPDGWKHVAFFMNWASASPTCPADAPQLEFEGSSVRGVDPTCPTCSCDTPVGACKPPTTWTVGSSACVGNDVWTNFDPPAGWDGSCTSNTAIPEGILCGGKPCVASINISAPVIEEEPCAAHANVPPIDIPRLKADGPYATVGRACSGNPWPSCTTAGEVCVPPIDAPFAACIMHEGDVLCPNGWNSKQILYGKIDDQRSCSECSCLPSIGATCSMKVQLFSEAMCSNTRLEVDVSLDMGTKCHPIMSGVALAAKSADVLEYKPGACEPSGGELLGDVVLTDARTFCCRTSPM